MNLQYKWDHDPLQSYFSKQVICTLSRWKSSPPHSDIWWLGCWELDLSPCPPDGEKQNHNSNSSDLIWVLHYFWKCWRIKVSQEETLNLVFFLLIHSKANPLLSWQVCSSSGEVSPGCSWMLFLKVLRVPGILKLWGLTQISGSPSFQVKRRI